MSKPNVPLSLCHQCGANLDAASLIQKKGLPRPNKVQAVPGDVSICMYCGCIHKFGSDLLLTKASKGDLMACMLANPETYDVLMTTQQVIFRFIKEFPDLARKSHKKPY